MACSQYFCARDQRLKPINLAGSRNALKNEIESYRVATHAYRFTIFNAVMTMVKKLIPIILLPKQVWEQILNAVALKKVTSNGRLKLAIPPTKILTY